MARFQAGCKGSGYEVTRLGTTGSGAQGFAAGWSGRVFVRTFAEGERDFYRVALGPHQYSGGQDWTLAYGRLDANRNPAPDVAPCLVRLLAKAAQAADALAEENAARVDRALALAQAADEAHADQTAALAATVGQDRGEEVGRIMQAKDAAAWAVDAAARAVKTANRATARACTEMVRTRRALGHAERMAAKLEDADTGTASVDRLGLVAYEAENEAAAALDVYIAATGGGQAGGGHEDHAGAHGAAA